MRILWLSWRDIKNPSAGGAEKVAIEITSRLVKDGHYVTIFTSNFKNSIHQELCQGVKIIRQGNLLTCRLFAFFYYLKNRNFDLIIDEINTIPFFSVLYAKNKTITLIYQLAREYWFTQTIWPVSLIGYQIEPFLLSFYKKSPTMVISKSTKNNLKKLGFKKVSIVRIGLDFAPQANNVKSNLILFIGRLTAAKGPQDAIYAFKLINQKFPKTKLAVVGRGDPKFTVYLKKLTYENKLGNKVLFTNFIPQAQKLALLKKATIVLIPSVREGWNLVATEANATGAVPIAYNVPGLRDSIKNGETGILVEKNPVKLALAAIEILEDDQKRIKLSQNGLKFAQQFSWNNTYEDVKQFIFARRTPRPAGMNAHKRIHTFEG